MKRRCLVAGLRKKFPVWPCPAKFDFFLPFSIVIFQVPNCPLATTAQQRDEKVEEYKRKNIARDGDKHPRQGAGRVPLLSCAAGRRGCGGKGQGDRSHGCGSIQTTNTLSESVGIACMTYKRTVRLYRADAGRVRVQSPFLKHPIYDLIIQSMGATTHS